MANDTIDEHKQKLHELKIMDMTLAFREYEEEQDEMLEAVEKRAEQMQDLVKEIVNILRKNGTLSRMKELPPVDLDTKESGLFGINVSPLRTSMNAPIRYKVASAAIVAVVAVLVSRLKQ